VFKPFANSTDVLNIQGDALSITNDTGRITMSGELAIPRDQSGLALALALQEAVNAIVNVLRQDAALPARLKDEPPKPTGTADNPFI
jgi:hypothetical protein